MKARALSVASERRGHALTLLASAMALAAGAIRTQETQPASQPAEVEKGVPVFADGQAQVVKAFADRASWIKHDLWVETTFDTDGDGKPDRMHVSVTRQKQTETEGLKVPVVYETSPYFSGTGTTDKQYFWDPKHELGATPPVRKTMPSIRFSDQRSLPGAGENWVPRGFAAVRSSSPGTGLSQGCPTVGGANESLAPKAVIDWLNGRASGYTSPVGGEKVEASWCTGKVGMIGTSYNGTLPVAAATTGVAGLEAIIPIAPNTSYWHYYRSNGLVRHPGGYMGEDIDVLYEFINSGNPSNREYCDKKIRDEELLKNQDRLTGDLNAFWAGRDYITQLASYRAATLVAHAFNDWNVMPEHSVRLYAELKRKGVPCQAYFHQGGHGGPPPLEMMNRWFTRYLYGVENDVEKDPRAWIVREGAQRGAKPTPYADYPNPDAKPVRLHPTAGGAAVGGLGTAPGAAEQTEKLVDNVEVRGAQLAQAESSEHRLLYATPPLVEPVHVSGTARLTIKLSSSRPAANFSVWLVSLPWTATAASRPETRRAPIAPITDDVITRGWADPQNHRSIKESEPLVPGRFYELSFDLQPDDQVIKAGERIGLMIFSSDYDFTLWPKPGTELTIDLRATSLELPVVGGAAAFGRAVGAGGDKR